MCGIFGAINFKEPFSGDQKIDFQKSLDIISYRGPDAVSSMYFNSLSSDDLDSNIFLAHRRLAIIDLSNDGIQPFTNDNNIFITFNGEIYNYIELRQELKEIGFEFKTKTDIEVIVNLYKAYGEAGFEKMNGMWAFVIYDKEKNRIVASRDRFSIKPLYYYKNAKSIYFSSEIKQILPYLDKKEVNLDVLGNYLKNYIIDYSEETFFKDIYKVPAKNNFIIDLNQLEFSSSQYWDFETENLNHLKSNELEERYKTLFTDSIKLRLRSDVKIGNTLSGGLDSSSIAVIADGIKNEPIQNISVVSNNKNLSEEKYVDSLISKGALVKKIKIEDISPWDNLKQVIWHNDEPILSMSTVAHFNMMKKFEEETDITVILSGQGGDESLAGYNKYFFYKLAELKRNGKYLNLFADTIKLLPKFFDEFDLKNAKRYLSFIEDKSIVNKVIKFKFTNQFITDAKTFVDRQKMDINKFSVPALTHYEDRSSMFQSKEIRLPFLDYRLVNFSLNLPINQKINKGYNKYILRKSITELPQDIAWRKDKKGFTIDEGVYYDEKGTKYIKELFSNSKLEELGLIDSKLFLNEFNDFLLGKTKYWVRNINRIIFAEIWAQTYID